MENTVLFYENTRAVDRFTCRKNLAKYIVLPQREINVSVLQNSNYISEMSFCIVFYNTKMSVAMCECKIANQDNNRIIVVKPSVLKFTIVRVVVFWFWQAARSEHYHFLRVEKL